MEISMTGLGFIVWNASWRQKFVTTPRYTSSETDWGRGTGAAGGYKMRLHWISGSPHDLMGRLSWNFSESRKQQPLVTSFSALVMGWGPRRHTLGGQELLKVGWPSCPWPGCMCRGVLCSGARAQLCHVASFWGYLCPGFWGGKGRLCCWRSGLESHAVDSSSPGLLWE